MANDRAIARSILQAADLAVGVERTGHGDVEASFTMIAELWSVHINHATAKATGLSVSPQIHLTARDVAEMMQDVKRARATYGSGRDNYVDRAGYAALAGMLDATTLGIGGVPAAAPAPAAGQQAGTDDIGMPASQLGFLQSEGEENLNA